jgi:hypothetical protein
MSTHHVVPGRRLGCFSIRSGIGFATHRFESQCSLDTPSGTAWELDYQKGDFFDPGDFLFLTTFDRRTELKIKSPSGKLKYRAMLNEGDVDANGEIYFLKGRNEVEKLTFYVYSTQCRTTGGASVDGLHIEIFEDSYVGARPEATRSDLPTCPASCLPISFASTAVSGLQIVIMQSGEGGGIPYP